MLVLVVRQGRFDASFASTAS